MLKHILTWLYMPPRDVSGLVLHCLLLACLLTWILALQAISLAIVGLFLPPDSRIVEVQVLSIVRKISRSIELDEQSSILIIALVRILFEFTIWITSWSWSVLKGVQLNRVKGSIKRSTTSIFYSLLYIPKSFLEYSPQLL